MFSSTLSVLRQPHVFISFKTEEEQAAAQLKAALEAGGFSVWWQQSIQCGREWHSDIDSAILAAGCIVVLWSPASIVSPWVRHEASQAVARGIYTPVRLVPMAIGSPFDRLQATDLFGWTGDPNHPGLLRLLARANQLIPAPLPLHKRLVSYIRGNWLALIIATVAAASIAMLVRLSLGLETQLAAQAAVAHSVQRTLDPLSDFEVTAYLNIDPSTPGVAEYLARLHDFFHVSGDGSLPKESKMPPGANVVRSRADGTIETIAFGLDSELWPQDTSSSWLGSVSRYVEIHIKLSRPTASNGSEPDLEFDAGSYDPDGSEGGGSRNTGSINWNVSSNTLELHFTDIAAKKNWRSNGEIAAFPDLQSAVITIEIASTSYSSVSDQAAVAGIDASRRKLALSTIFLGASGRRVMLRASAMQAGRDTKSMPAYSGKFGRVGEKLKI